MGHKNVTTTQHYLRFQPDELKQYFPSLIPIIDNLNKRDENVQKSLFFDILHLFLPISSHFVTQNTPLSKEMLVMGALSYLYNHLFPIGTVLANLDAYKGRYVQKTDIFS